MMQTGPHGQTTAMDGASVGILKGRSRPFLLAAKLYIPRPVPTLVARPALLKLLNDMIHYKLGLLTAPAGAGKTTLLSAWVAQTASPCAWLTLDERDNDGVRFLTYLIAALQRLDAKLGRTTLELFHAPGPLNLEDALIPLMNDLGLLEHDMLLVLDDYHVITDETVHMILQFLLSHQPEHFHLVIASRGDLPLSLARLRAANHLLEVQERDFRFTFTEAAQLFTTFLERRPEDSEIRELMMRTEGWVTGLQLAAVYLRNHHSYREAIAQFKGNHRFVADYLAEEVFDRQPEQVQHFLLKTALLQRFNAALCTALDSIGLPHVVMSSDDSVQMLRILESQQVFLIPLDEERQWYRYHHLFAQFLRERLQRQYPEWGVMIHRQACHWYRQHGFFEDAIEHALAAGEHAQAVEMIELATPILLLRGEVGMLRHWLESLPVTLLQQRLTLAVALLWTFTLLGQFDKVDSQIGEITQRLERQRQEGGETQATLELQGEISAISALLALVKRDFTQAVQQGRVAVALIANEHLFARCVATIALGSASRAKGDIVQARAAFAEVIVYGQMRESVTLVIFASHQLGQLCLEQGQLQQAAQVYRKVLQLVHEEKGKNLPVTAFACIEFAGILREWNQFAEAEALIEEGLRIGAWMDVLEVILTGLLASLRLKLSQGDLVAAWQILERAESRVPETRNPRFRVELTAARIDLWLRQGKVAAATAWFGQTLGKELPEKAFRHIIHFTQIRLLLADQRWEEARQQLDTCQVEGQVFPRVPGESFIVDRLYAKIDTMQGKMESALERVADLLSQTEAEGYIRLYLDEGEWMLTLLRRLLAQGRHTRYIHLLLGRIAKRSGEPVVTVASADMARGQLLSIREYEILQLIARGYTNQQMAEQLVVSVGTVKTHINNMFRKLAVESRTQALARARELGIALQ